jgi:cyclopropane fatty-acyl-phospholipid synthase-like methyltransferase
VCSFKNKIATKKEIAAHYDRGNDFFRAFLGPRMVYTSGVYYDKPSWSKPGKTAGYGEQVGGTTLEEAQDNKMSLICEKLQLKKGDEYLDIGCGWGTLMRHGAREFGAKSVGVTLSVEGAKWCNAQIEAEGISDTAEILCCDYRDIPKERKFQAISAIEMAEHVGIANFQLFLGNIYNMLEVRGSSRFAVHFPLIVGKQYMSLLRVHLLLRQDDGTYLMQVSLMHEFCNVSVRK